MLAETFGHEGLCERAAPVFHHVARQQSTTLFERARRAPQCLRAGPQGDGHQTRDDGGDAERVHQFASNDTRPRSGRS